MSQALHPTAAQSAALAALPAGAPVAMINLLKFRKPDGLEHFIRYSQEVAPLMRLAGATVRYAGSAQVVVLGDDEPCWWDAIVVVEYPSPKAFSDMVTGEDYGRVYPHRAAAVDRAGLIATAVWAPRPTR